MTYRVHQPRKSLLLGQTYEERKHKDLVNQRDNKNRVIRLEKTYICGGASELAIMGSNIQRQYRSDVTGFQQSDRFEANLRGSIEGCVKNGLLG